MLHVNKESKIGLCSYSNATLDIFFKTKTVSGVLTRKLIFIDKVYLSGISGYLMNPWGYATNVIAAASTSKRDTRRMNDSKRSQYHHLHSCNWPMSRVLEVRVISFIS